MFTNVNSFAFMGEFYLNYEECKLTVGAIPSVEIIRFILTMRNVNLNPYEDSLCFLFSFILTMRNVN